MRASLCFLAKQWSNFCKSSWNWFKIAKTNLKQLKWHVFTHFFSSQISSPRSPYPPYLLLLLPQSFSDHRSAAPSSTSSAAHQWTSDHLLVPISSVNSPFKLVLFTPNLLLPPPSVSPDLVIDFIFYLISCLIDHNLLMVGNRPVVTTVDCRSGWGFALCGFEFEEDWCGSWTLKFKPIFVNNLVRLVILLDSFRLISWFTCWAIFCFTCWAIFVSYCAVVGKICGFWIRFFSRNNVNGLKWKLFRKESLNGELTGEIGVYCFKNLFSCNGATRLCEITHYYLFGLLLIVAKQTGNLCYIYMLSLNQIIHTVLNCDCNCKCCRVFARIVIWFICNY